MSVSRKENGEDRLSGPPPPSLLESQNPQQVCHPSGPVCLLELQSSFSGVKTFPENSAPQASVSCQSPRWLLTSELTEAHSLVSLHLQRRP